MDSTDMIERDPKRKKKKPKNAFYYESTTSKKMEYRGPSCVIPGLFIGDYKDAVCCGGDLELFNTLGICRVLNCCGGRYPDEKYLDNLAKRASSQTNRESLFAIRLVCDYGTTNLMSDKNIRKGVAFISDA
jgi:hypothetical protein